METNHWEERYRARERPEEDFATAPTPLVAKTASRLTPGRALDLRLRHRPQRNLAGPEQLERHSSR